MQLFLFQSVGFEKICHCIASVSYTHLDVYKRQGKQYPGIDLAILENGQYNEDWKYIHTMPQYLGQVARDLNAEKILTVHHSQICFG